MRYRNLCLYCLWKDIDLTRESIILFLMFMQGLKLAYQTCKFTNDEAEIEIRERLGEPQ